MKKNYRVTFICLGFAADNYLSNHFKVFSDVESDLILLDRDPVIKSIYSRRSLLSIPLELSFIIYRLILRRPSLVVSVGPKAGLLSLVASKLLLLSNAHWFTGQVWCLSHKPKSKLSYWLDWLLLKFSTHCVADSCSQSLFLESNFKFASVDCLDVGSINGVRDIYFRAPRELSENKSIVIGYLGRKANDKGFPILGEIVESFRDDPRFTFLVAGPVEEADACEYHRFIESFTGKGSRVEIIDSFVSPNDFFARVDLLCHPSLREGFGSVVLEAQASGLPVICSNIYGFKNTFVNGVTGFSCNATSDYVRAIRWFADHPSEYKDFSFRGIEFAKQHSDDRFFVLLRDLYRRYSGDLF